MRDEIDRLKQEIIALEKLEDKKAQRLFRKFFL